MPVKAKQNVPVSLALRPETVDKFTANRADISPIEIMGARATQVLEGMADGGLFLTVDQVTAIENAIKQPIRNGTDVVAAAQKSGNMEDGKYVFRFPIDPSYVPALEEIAHSAGRTVDDLIKEMTDLALENNWAYTVMFQGPRRTFCYEDEAYFADLLERKDFTVKDLREYVSTHRGNRKVSKPEAEPVSA